MGDILTLEKISHTFAENDGEKVLDDLCLAVSCGEFIWIKGESGAGKSTLLRIAGGILKPCEGIVRYEQNDIYAQNDAELSRWRAENVGYLFQSPKLVQALTVVENIKLSAFVNKKNPKEQSADSINELLCMVGLEKFGDYLPRRLSGGQRRRAALAAMLAKNPQLIIADEPTNDLDSKWINEVLLILKEQTKTGTSVIIASHDDVCDKFADAVYLLQNQKITKA